MAEKSYGVGFDAEGTRPVPEGWARGGERASEPAVAVPVVEDEMRVGKREEPRITRRQTEGRETRGVTLLSEEVSVERTGPGGHGDADEADGRPA